MYHEAIRANRFRMIQRTEGVSTTTFIGRLLQVTRPKTLNVALAGEEKPVAVSATLLPTGSRMSSFAAGLPALARAKRVMYVDGTFDVFHHGHLQFLRLAREQGDYLLVGLHSDEVAASTHGPGHPIMSLHERALCLLACKYVDDIILGAPFAVTANLCTSMNISVVCAGAANTNAKMRKQQDPYAVPKEMCAIACSRLLHCVEWRGPGWRVDIVSPLWLAGLQGDLSGCPIRQLGHDICHPGADRRELRRVQNTQRGEREGRGCV